MTELSSDHSRESFDSSSDSRASSSVETRFATRQATQNNCATIDNFSSLFRLQDDDDDDVLLDVSVNGKPKLVNFKGENEDGL